MTKKTSDYVPVLERFKLWHAADSLCSFPECNADLASIAFDDGVIPSIPHIISSKKNGPRADAAYPRALINTYVNFILLCDRHHKKVDKMPVTTYNAQCLREMKMRHEGLTRAGRTNGSQWQDLLGSILYANIARLFIDFGGDRIVTSGPIRSTRLPESRVADMSAVEMHSYSLLVWDSLRRHTRNAVPLTPGLKLTRSMIGSRFVWWRKIRGKNVYDRQGHPKPITGNPSIDPQISFRQLQRKCVMLVDPKWALTSTGKGMLNGAKYTPELVGISVLRELSATEVVMSPLAIGFPAEGVYRNWAKLRRP